MTQDNSKLLYTDAEWSFDKIDRVYEEIEKIAKEELKLDWYPNQIEIISSEQMLDAYTSVGMPIMYNHWSFGKRFVEEYTKYRKGMMGLAYEIVINSDPCISYLMEENTMTMQTLVIAHAAFGHNHFFKNNNLFKEWTDAKEIVPYLSFAKKYIADCEERYGEREVEMILNSAHALKNHGIDKYPRKQKMSVHEEQLLQTDREKFLSANVNHLWDSLTDRNKETEDDRLFKGGFPGKPEENILRFMEEHSPILEPWQREIIRIVRTIAQYFYPQAQTKVMNEGTATYVHYYIMNRLFDKGMISDGNMQEFLHSHTGVVFQPKFDDQIRVLGEDGQEKIYNRYNGINPYALGFDMFRDIERICKEPTEEDKYYFPEIAGKDWIETFHFAINNFRDESFIRQFLSPTLVRKWKMFSMEDNANNSHYTISAIQNEEGFESIRNTLADHYTMANYTPDITVTDVDIKRTRKMCLTHKAYKDIELSKDDSSIEDMMMHLFRLWGHRIQITSFDENDESIETFVTSDEHDEDEDEQ
jgi:spore cortex formation protein SpoVR/YcgB (stage V sporulation)